MSETPLPESPRPPEKPLQPARVHTAQVALGVFICWQLWFLFSQNLFGQLEDVQGEIKKEETTQHVERLAPGFTRKSGHIFEFAKWVTASNRLWLEVTGQAQSWGLFSDSYDDCSFPCLILRWDNEDALDFPFGEGGEMHPMEAEMLWHERWRERPAPTGPKPLVCISPHEPSDPTHYFRWRQMRMRRYENSIALILDPDGCDDREEIAKWYEEKISEHLRKRGYMMTAYMKLRLRELKAEYQDNPEYKDLGEPKQVVFVVRRYRTVKPEDGPPWHRGPYTVPLAVWYPPGPDEKGNGTYRRYEPKSNTLSEPMKQL